MLLKKAGSNWVDGDRFHNRDAELETLAERAYGGVHTLVTAPRRMGKTSLVREFLRRAQHSGNFETIFIDLEDASDASDAIAELAAQSRKSRSGWERIKSGFGRLIGGFSGNIDSLGLAELRVQFRAQINAGNRWRKGDEIFAALATGKRPVILAIDELPILVNRLLTREQHDSASARTQEVDELLSWLRKNGQEHRGRVILVLSGSVGLEPILRRAGMSAQINIFEPLALPPWNQSVALGCLYALAENYGLELPDTVSREICRRLRCLVPHHVQQFFDHLHEHLRRAGRIRANLNDVEHVYRDELLSIRGQMNNEHYQSRLRIVLNETEYPAALELLTEASVNGGLLRDETINQYRKHFQTVQAPGGPFLNLEDVLYLLEHDGYLVRHADGYRFLSGFLQDWWQARNGRNFVPLAERVS